MKYIYGIAFLIFLLSSKPTWGQEDSTSVLNTRISVEAVKEPLADILDQISVKSNLFFSYDASLLDAAQKATLHFREITVKAALDSLFHSEFNYTVIGDQVVITRPESDDREKPAETTDLSQAGLIIFKGKIVDDRENSPLPYASVAILKKNLGTITNTDGEFELKIPAQFKTDSLIVSTLGYQQIRFPVSSVLTESSLIRLKPISYPLREIKVTVIDAASVVEKIVEKIPLNYPVEPESMTAFYREVLKQDDKYIDVAEALLEIKKSPYGESFPEDKIKFVKGRKNLALKPFSIVDFKIQGGPYYATKLDLAKTLESFMSPEYRDFYKFTLDEIIEFNNRDTYVVEFKPTVKMDNISYQGRLYVDMSTFALVHADFSLSRWGLKYAHHFLIKKKPKDFFVRPLNADYSVSYRKVNNKWHLNNAQTSVSFKVRSKSDRVNSIFHSDSELLVTDFRADAGERYRKNELFNSKDIFSEMITTYDENFWKDYNIIKPSEDLRLALKAYYEKNDTLFNDHPSQIK